MRRTASSLPLVAVLVALVVAGGVHAGAGAEDAAPAPDYRWVAIVETELGAVDLAVAPGRRLELRYATWEAGATVSAHYSPTASVTCVASGALGLTLLEGVGTVTRTGFGAPQPPTVPMEIGAEVVLAAWDCIALDHEAGRVVLTARNASFESTVVWEARVVPMEEPETVYVDENGVPIG